MKINHNQTKRTGLIVPDEAETEGNLVWVPANGGTKYHLYAGCSDMIDSIQVSIETAINNGYPPAENVIKNLFSTSGKCGIIFVNLASKKEKCEIGDENGRKNVKNTARKCRKNVGISLEKAWNFVKGTFVFPFRGRILHRLRMSYSVLKSYEDSADRADEALFLI